MARTRTRRREGRSPFTVGLIALIVILILVFLGFTKDIPFTRPYQVKAVFQSSNSLRPDSPVRIAGVEVGKVKKVDGGGGHRRRGRDDVDQQVRPAAARGRDGEDPPAHLPRGQLLRRPAARHARLARARRRRHDQGHADLDAGPARPGADRAAVRHAPGPARRARGPRHRAELRAERGRRPRRRSVRARRDRRGVVQRRLRRRRPGRALAVAGQRGVPRPRARGGPRAADRGRRQDGRRPRPQRDPAQGPGVELQHDDGGARLGGVEPAQPRSASSRRRSRTRTPRSPRSTRPSRRRAPSRARSCPACARRRRRSTPRSRGSSRRAG